MGMSLTAHLYYGFPLKETIQDDEAYNAELYDWLGELGYEDQQAAEAGIVEPDHQDYKAPEWKEFWTKKKQVTDATPCIVKMVGHTEFRYFVLAIRVTHEEKHALDNTAVDIPPIDPAWDRQLKAWCEKYGFAYQVPSWHIAPYYA